MKERVLGRISPRQGGQGLNRGSHGGNGGSRVFRRGFLCALAVGMLSLAVSTPALAQGDPNYGDVWVDNVGQPAGPGHEMDPHLACQDINLWGNGLEDSSGNYTIDGWDPSGTHELDYSGTWSYDQSRGGDQVVSVIDVAQLLSTAAANGDAPQNSQGYHFKLQFVQDPQKHKTFWVSCAPAIQLVKVERIGSSGAFTHDPAVSGLVGDTVNYRMTVTNSGDTPLTLAFSDDRCDSGTLSAPSVISGGYDAASQVLAPGAVLRYTCSHVLAGGDQPYTNTASVIGTPPPGEGSPVSAQDQVQAYAVMASPGMTSSASSGLVGDSIQDAAILSGGYSPTGTITWKLYGPTDPGCSGTPLRTYSGATVSGDGTYYSPKYLTSVAGTYQWVASYSGDANNNGAVGACPDPSEQSTVVNGPAPAIRLRKLEQTGRSGFTHGPVVNEAGKMVNYEMLVTNTGNTSLVIAFTDGQCDTGTLSAPSVVSGHFDASTGTLSAGGVLRYTCSHVLGSNDDPYVNTADVVGTAPGGQQVSAQDSVQAFAITQTITPKKKKHSVKGKRIRRCRTSSGMVVKYKGHHKPKACRKPSKPPKRHHRGFTG